MTAPTPYLTLPGTTRAALTLWREVFGGEVELHTYAGFGRSDGPGHAVAHGILRGPVDLYASDAAPGEVTFSGDGLLVALLGTADPATLHRWFDALAASGTTLEPLQQRPWGAWDGQVRDAYGVTWLIGYETDQPQN